MSGKWHLESADGPRVTDDETWLLAPYPGAVPLLDRHGDLWWADETDLMENRDGVKVVWDG